MPPLGMDFDPSGNVYVGEQVNNRVDKWNNCGPTPTVTPTITPTPRRTPALTQYTIDGNGNLITETETRPNGNVNVTTYTYDFENRLKSITYPAGNTDNFTYNYAGELLKRTTTQGTINYVYGQG